MRKIRYRLSDCGSEIIVQTKTWYYPFWKECPQWSWMSHVYGWTINPEKKWKYVGKNN
jgi:hypothetical protein